jgi:hypothetical protein
MALACESGPEEGLIDEKKTEGRKSCGTVSIKCITHRPPFVDVTILND